MATDGLESTDAAAVDTEPPQRVTGAEDRGPWRRVLPFVLVLLAFAVVAGGGYVAYTLLVDQVAAPDEEAIARAAAEVEDAVSAGVIDEVRATVLDTHDVLNDELGFGGVADLDPATFDTEHGRQLQEDLTRVIERVNHEVLARDLETARELLRIGAETGDTEAFVLAHRVLHDLDHFAFNPEREEGPYWGVTVTLEGEDNDAQRYLAEARG